MGEWKALKKASGTGWKELEREAGTGWKALLYETAYEDFTTFAEVDVGSDRIQKTANHVDHAAYRNEDTYLYKGYGVGHFGDFTHKIKARSGFTQDFSVGYVWGLANNIDDFYGLGVTGKTAIGVRFYRSGANRYIQLQEVYTSNWYTDGYLGASTNTYYYIKIVKSGTSLIATIYSDPNYSTLIDTLVLTLHGNWTFRYLYGCSAYNNGMGAYQINDIENFDIGE